jgi:hypothetical protein
VEPNRESPTRRETVAGPVATKRAGAPEGDDGIDAFIGEPLDPHSLERLSQEGTGGVALAESLVVFRAQIDAMAPHRSRAYDGTIGDAVHRHRPSRHNPNGAGVVSAIDITDDPVNGCPIHRIAERVSVNPHPDLAYIISDHRIAGRSTASQCHRYTRPNPLRQHAHFAVGRGPDDEPGPPYDHQQPQRGVDGTKANAAVPRTLRRGTRGEDMRGLQKVLIGAGRPASGADGIVGPKMQAAVRKPQGELDRSADGVVGPLTHAAIARLVARLAGTVGSRYVWVTSREERTVEGRSEAAVTVALVPTVAPIARIRPERLPSHSSSRSSVRTDRCSSNAQCGVLYPPAAPVPRIEPAGNRVTTKADK